MWDDEPHFFNKSMLFYFTFFEDLSINSTGRERERETARREEQRKRE